MEISTRLCPPGQQRADKYCPALYDERPSRCPHPEGLPPMPTGRPIRWHFLVPALLALAAPGRAEACPLAAVPPEQARPAKAGRLDLHRVSVPIRSTRLLDMSMDADGFIWAGSFHRDLYRYDPRTGAVETVRLPEKAFASACVCAGDKVY